MTSATLSTLSTATFALALAMLGVVYARLKSARPQAADAATDSPAGIVAKGDAPVTLVPRRVAAISGSDLTYAVSARSIARQAAPYHTRPIKHPAGSQPMVVPMALVARRPGLAKQSPRIERRLAVVR